MTTTQGDIGRQVMEVVIRSPGCEVEELVSACPNLTWNQVFIELDRFIRAGRIILKQKGGGRYTVAPGLEAGAAAEVIH